MELKDLLNNPPVLHRDGDGNPVSYHLNEEVLAFLDENVRGDSKTLETGAGVSTILFAMKGTEHICMVPDREQVERIKEYCSRNKISAQRVDFKIDKSESALPKLESGRFDLVLIDGNHAFPTPFIDWYYTAPVLKTGGMLVIDDTQLWTGETLRNFLLSEPEWELKKDFSNRNIGTSVFIKLKEGSEQKWWGEQPYLVSHSKLGHNKIRTAAELLLKGKFSSIFSKMLRK